MKKSIVILAFATALALLSGCDEEKVVEFGSLQQRGGVYVVPETQKPYSGKFVETRENVVVKAGSFKNGKLHGELTIYQKDGSILGMINYKDGILQRGSFTDSRDGKKYATVKIGAQTWMAENLNYNAGGSKCYGNDESNCKTYGRLYDWNTALKACPSGWHLPDGDEWQKLVDIAGGETAGAILKSSSGWNNDGNGTDEFGFSALPGGGGYSDGSFGNVGNFGYWWSATEHGADNAYYRYMGYDKSDVYRSYDDKSNLYSVRCLQD